MISDLSPTVNNPLRLASRRPSDVLGIPKPEQHWPEYPHCRRKPPAAPSMVPLCSLSWNQLLDRYLASEAGTVEAQTYAAALRARSQLRPSLN